ncbi:MAG: Asp-tRNA(Asn)/Glu-tRNA(Gln) amidotransferase subunit GatA [Anaerolineaceae bacterium]|nr:Asp-tRNA(Asn)/Glu-tRNA(Gln) amidotransferase subunit GatA [Anaerolineaceae bacterium]
MTDLTNLTLVQAQRALHSGECSSVELTRACLERIARLEPCIHAFITHTPQAALEAASQADLRRARWKKEGGSMLPPLLGIPLAVKDLLCLAGVRCTCGSRILENFIPPYSATAVERLLAAGMVVVGKTNTDEYAMGSSTENSAFGPTHNPWDTGRVPGGSSGGSAAALAARFVPAALGSDTGGSVRQPASYCGVVGLKPTYGRVSRYGLVAYGSSLDTVGPFTRTVADAALIFEHMAGYDRHDATSADLPVSSTCLDDNADLSGLRIGVPDEYFIAGIQPEVTNAVRTAIAVFEAQGAVVFPVSLPHTQYALPVYYLIASSEASANLARYDGIRFGARRDADNLFDLFSRTRGQNFGAEVKRRIMLGTYALSAGYYDAYYGQAQKVRTLIQRDFDKAFEQVDLIAAPVAPSTAFRFNEHLDDPLAMYLEDVFTLPANLAGVPGLAFPAGFDSAHLPIGMQLMAAPFREDILFRAGHAYQQITDWHQAAPSLP